MGVIRLVEPGQLGGLGFQSAGEAKTMVWSWIKMNSVNDGLLPARRPGWPRWQAGTADRSIPGLNGPKFVANLRILRNRLH